MTKKCRSILDTLQRGTYLAKGVIPRGPARPVLIEMVNMTDEECLTDRPRIRCPEIPEWRPDAREACELWLSNSWRRKTPDALE